MGAYIKAGIPMLFNRLTFQSLIHLVNQLTNLKITQMKNVSWPAGCRPGSIAVSARVKFTKTRL